MERIEELRERAGRAYCDYADQLRKQECLGCEQKLKEGIFGKAELDAHIRAGELLGRHQALAEVYAELLATPGPEGDKFREGLSDRPDLVDHFERTGLLAAPPSAAPHYTEHAASCSYWATNVCDCKAAAAPAEPLPSGEPTPEELAKWSHPEFVLWYIDFAHWDSKEECYEAWQQARAAAVLKGVKAGRNAAMRGLTEQDVAEAYQRAPNWKAVASSLAYRLNRALNPEQIAKQAMEQP